MHQHPFTLLRICLYNEKGEDAVLLSLMSTDFDVGADQVV
jgi:hypothetical protein